MTPQLQKKLEYLATGTTRDYLVDYLSYIKDQVADVRISINCPPEVENSVRRGVIQVIDQLVIAKLKVEKASKKENDLYN